MPALELVVSGIWRCSVCCWIDLLETLRTPCAKCRRSGSQATHEPRSKLMVSLKGHLAFTWSLELIPPSCPPKTENTGKSGNVDRMLAHRLGSVRTWLLSVWGGANIHFCSTRTQRTGDGLQHPPTTAFSHVQTPSKVPNAVVGTCALVAVALLLLGRSRYGDSKRRMDSLNGGSRSPAMG